MDDSADSEYDSCECAARQHNTRLRPHFGRRSSLKLAQQADRYVASLGGLLTPCSPSNSLTRGTLPQTSVTDNALNVGNDQLWYDMPFLMCDNFEDSEDCDDYDDARCGHYTSFGASETPHRNAFGSDMNKHNTTLPQGKHCTTTPIYDAVPLSTDSNLEDINYWLAQSQTQLSHCQRKFSMDNEMVDPDEYLSNSTARRQSTLVSALEMCESNMRWLELWINVPHGCLSNGEVDKLFHNWSALKVQLVDCINSLGERNQLVDTVEKIIRQKINVEKNLCMFDSIATAKDCLHNFEGQREHNVSARSQLESLHILLPQFLSKFMSKTWLDKREFDISVLISRTQCVEQSCISKQKEAQAVIERVYRATSSLTAIYNYYQVICLCISAFIVFILLCMLILTADIPYATVTFSYTFGPPPI